jgi:transcriptional regulator of acetoin/glycerol metabolism
MRQSDSVEDADEGRTDSAASERPALPSAEWTLVIAMDCQNLSDAPRSIDLAGVTEVIIERGQEHGLERTGSTIHLELADRWVSRHHARIVRRGNLWSMEDGESRNGSRVNAERVDCKSLGDGDVVECGGTHLVLRRFDRPTSVGTDPEPLEALRTLSPALGHEISILRKVARSTVPILVLGESGSGKEGIASAIHALSGRDGPLLAVNCGAIPATLIESELFGTRRGAFSGAEDRPGLLRAAERGTLFLDEVAELPLASQAALLRFLQEKELIPLGSSRPISVDVRIVAATNRPVDQFVAEGKLRRDLYARLCSYVLQLPPLRERREDLGALVATLIARHDRSGTRRTLSRAVARALFAYDWPLNIRELEQTILAALALAPREIGLDQLRSPIRDAADSAAYKANAEREMILGLLRKHSGNLSAVARDLETSRSHLYRLLERHMITPDIRTQGTA